MTIASSPKSISKAKVIVPSATSYLKNLLNRELSVTDYVTQCLKNVDLYESQIHAWVNFDKTAVLERAAFLDQGFENHRESIGQSFANRLYGIPIGVKDIFNTTDMPTEHGTAIFKGYTPGNDARVVTDVRRSNGIVFGKTVTAELGVHTPGPTKNPLDLSRTPGTSSSGSAAAVACGMVPLALASQTNGSTIRPASYCGIIGFKPSFGVLPRTAMLKTTDTLDTVGIMGAYLSDILMLFNVLRVEGLNYPIVNEKLISYPNLDNRWRVAILNSEYSNDQAQELNDQLSEISHNLSGVGCDVSAFDLPKLFDNSYETHTTIYHSALAYYFKREWGLYPELFSNNFADIIREGNNITVESYQQACALQTKMINAFQEIFDQFDILLCPSALSEAPVKTDEFIRPDYNHLITMCHSPAISLPVMQGKMGLPIGIQCIAKKYHDYQLFDFCNFLLNELNSDVIA